MANVATCDNIIIQHQYPSPRNNRRDKLWTEEQVLPTGPLGNSHILYQLYLQLTVCSLSFVREIFMVE